MIDLDIPFKTPVIDKGVLTSSPEEQSPVKEQTEEKTRQVRDSDYWDAPVGTPLPLAKPSRRVKPDARTLLPGPTAPDTTLTITPVPGDKWHHETVTYRGQTYTIGPDFGRFYGDKPSVAVYQDGEHLGTNNNREDAIANILVHSLTPDDYARAERARETGEPLDLFPFPHNYSTAEVGDESGLDIGYYKPLTYAVEAIKDGPIPDAQPTTWSSYYESEKSTSLLYVYTNGLRDRKLRIERTRETIDRMTPEQRRTGTSIVDRIRSEGVVMIAEDEEAAATIFSVGTEGGGATIPSVREPPWKPPNRQGRILSQFEVHSSNGAYAPRLRAQEEVAMFDLHPDLAREKRPVYGYISVGKPTQRSVSGYGHVRLQLKSQVRDRTTFMVDDSLASEGFPIPLTGEVTDEQKLGAFGANSDYIELADLRKVRDRRSPLMTLPEDEKSEYLLGLVQDHPTEYIEAQIHQGVSIDDIEAVWLPSLDRLTDEVYPMNRIRWIGQIASRAKELGIKVNWYEVAEEDL